MSGLEIPVILAAVSATASVASGVVGYMGAQQQAAGMEQQAKQAQLLAANRSQILRNNALAAQQDEQFQTGVAKFNQQESMLEASRKADLMNRDIAAQLAAREAAGSRRGLAGSSFEDLLSAESLRLEREESDFLYSAGQQGYQFSKSAELGDLRGNRAIEMGRYDSALAITEGQYQSSSLRSEANATRIGGIGTAIGGFGSAAGTMSGINYNKSWNPKNWKMT
jgi:hypothetical protein